MKMKGDEMMKRYAGYGVVFATVFAIGTTGALGEDAAPEFPKIGVAADLELFYENSDNVGREGDNDKFKSNQLYFDINGKFDKNLSAKLKLDGADIVSSDGKVVTEKIVEEANFTAKHIGGSPVTVVFGKDEMPFGLDYDKYLNDSIAHQFEIDKVWGFHGIVDIPGVGNVAAAAYQHRHSDDDEVDASNETGDNYAAKLTIDKLVKNLTVKLSGASESYSDTAVTDDDTGVTTTTMKDEETRYGAGAILKIGDLGNINAEYIAFNNLNGTPDYDPSLITLGVEYDVVDKTVIWGRYEIIDDDTPETTENDFWSVGVKYSPTKNYSLMVEYSNFNSGDMKDATDLNVAKGSTDDAILVGVRAKF